MTVDREYFVRGLQQVEYASSDEEKLFPYMCVLFESSNDSLRFSAGNGGCFAVVNYTDNNNLISSGESKIIFPNNNISNILRILKRVKSDTVDIKSSSENLAENMPMQLALLVDDLTIRIYGIEHFTKYPDLTKVANYNYSYQIPTQMQDWKYVAEAITASRYSFQDIIHDLKAVADINNGRLEIQTNSQMNRKVPFKTEDCITDIKKNKNDKPWFSCNAFYLIEMVKKNRKKKTVVLNFNDQSGLDGMLDKEKMKIMKPVLLRFPDETDKNGVMEKSFIFISLSLRWGDSYWLEEYENIESRYEILDL